jgi:site-specific recombinase XerD
MSLWQFKISNMNTLAVIEAENRPGTLETNTGFGGNDGNDATVESVTSHGYTNRELTVHETETIRYHLSNARSKNTRIAYETQWRLFVAWCKEQGFLPFPCEVSTVVLYLDAIASNDCKYSKLEQAVSAIRAVHQDNMHLLPESQQSITALSFRHPHIKAALSSIKRNMVEKGLNVIKKPRAFTQGEILSMVQACPQTPSGIQDKALFLLGVNIGLRASEFVSLELSDLTFDELGLDLRIRSSKNDQFGTGTNLFIGRLAPSQKDYDAVAAMEAWLRVRAMLDVEELPNVFLAFRKGGSVLHRNLAGDAHKLTRETVSSVVQRCAIRANIEISNQTVSSHGMRHSFITQGFARGLDGHTIAKSSRHKSMSVLMGYDQSSRRNATIAPKLWA